MDRKDRWPHNLPFFDMWHLPAAIPSAARRPTMSECAVSFSGVRGLQTCNVPLILIPSRSGAAFILDKVL